MSRADFPSFLERSLDALEREAPLAYAAVRDKLGTLCPRLEVDGETTWLRSAGGRLVTAGQGGELPAIISGRKTIEALVDARLSLLDALLADQVVMLAAPADLATLHDAWLCYLAGAVRCRSFPGLLDEFLRPAGAPLTAVQTLRSPHRNEAAHAS
jgi:hypothetical protein